MLYRYSRYKHPRGKIILNAEHGDLRKSMERKYEGEMLGS